MSDDVPEKSLTALFLEAFTQTGPIESRRDLAFGIGMTLLPFSLMGLTFVTIIAIQFGIVGIWSLYVVAAVSGLSCLGVVFIGQIVETIQRVHSIVGK